VGKDPDDIRREIEETRARMGETVDALGYKADVKARAKESISEKKERVVESVTNAKDRVVGSITGTASSAGESVTGAAGSARDTVTGAAGNVASTVSDMTPDAQQVKQGARRAAGVAQENPLGLAIGAVAAGFLAGMMIPSTKVEEERIGPIADQLKEKGQEAIQSGAQKAQEAAQSAIGSAAVNATQNLADRAQETFSSTSS
jgi:tetrahydromethanopterin S-methyltransferase subunit F